MVATIILLLLGYWISAIWLLVIAVLINWRTEAFALNFRSSKGHGKGQGVLTVLTYNLNRAYSTSVNNGGEQEVLEFIMQQDADIVLLQEFNPILHSEINEGLRKNYPYGTLYEEGNRFKSVFSRHPIQDYQQLDANGETMPICVMNVDVNGRTCCVVTCHLMSNNFSVVYREVKGHGLNLMAGVKKAITSIRMGCQVRQMQAETLLGHLKGKDTPILVCGDFNDVAQSAVMRTFVKAGFADAWWKTGCGFGFTYCGMWMRFRLDHILYNNRLNPCWIRVINSNLSDHRPLVAVFNI